MINASFFRAVNEPAVDPRSFSWDAFAEFLVNSRRVTPSKEGVPLFNCTAFSTPYRAKANVVSVSALVLDVDDLPGASVRGLLEKLSPHAFVFYTTHRHAGEPVRARVIVRLSRAVHAYEWDRFVAATRDWLGDTFDKCLANPSQAYYLPSCPPETAAQAQAFAWQGSPVDVDVALARAPAIIARTPLADVSPAEWRPEVALTRARLIEIAKMRAAVGYAARRVLLGEELAPRGARHEAVRDLVYACTKEYGPCMPDSEVLTLLEASCPNPPDKPQADAAWWRAQFSAWGMRAKAEAQHAAERAQRGVNARVEAALMTHAQAPSPVDTVVAQAFALASGGVPYTEAELKKQAKRCPNEAQKKVLDTILTGAGVLDEYTPHIEGAGKWLGKRELGRKLEDLKAPFLRYVMDPAHKEAFVRGLELGQQEGLLREPWRTACKPDAEGAIAVSEVNASYVLELHPDAQGRIAFDVRSASILFRDPPWGEESRPDANAMGAARWLKGVTDKDFPSSMVASALVYVAQKYPVDPLRNWVESLVWDRVPRLDTWLSRYCSARDTPLNRAIGAKILIAGIARVVDPGCKVDNALILEGKQGSGKTMTVEALCPSPEFFASASAQLRLADKDLLMTLTCGPWLVELGELHQLTKGDLAEAKQFMTNRVDRFRAPYGRAVESHPRRVLFIGNTDRPLESPDSAGNRRWWPVKVGRCDIEGLAHARNQIWAEAAYRYRAGEPWWFQSHDPLHLELEELQASLVVEDPWEAALHDMLTGETLLRPQMLAEKVLAASNDQRSYTRIRTLMTKYGWVRDVHKSKDGPDTTFTRWWRKRT